MLYYKGHKESNICSYIVRREVRYRLKQRAKFLQTLINESRQTVFLMEHYHDHSEEGDAHADCRAV